MRSRMTRLLLTLLISFIPLVKSQEAVVPPEVKVPLTETTYFCYDKAVTGFNPPYDKSVDFKELKFTGRWLPIDNDKAGFELKGEDLPLRREFYYCERINDWPDFRCVDDSNVIHFDTASLRGVRANMGGYIYEGDSVAIGVFKCEEF
jgi:hypothetical protein